ncbi:MAG: DUF1592 domain-containing protein [Myxococcales bacterium]|nr:DUF1592 domain-containing protein [Myxococcales bacterium]
MAKLLSKGWLAGLLTVACTGQIEPPPESHKAPLNPAPVTLKRLTQAQYKNAIHALLGAEIVVPSALEPDSEAGGFLNVGGSIASISSRGVEQYERAAYDIAEQAMEPGAERDALVPCAPAANVDDSCASAFVSSFGRKLWRRSLSQAEVDRYVAIASEAGRQLGDFYDGLEFAMAGLLQSPDFLFRVELGEADPGSSFKRYTSTEMASRLAFFLWNSTPDDDLLDAGERGDLLDESQIDAQVDRMLASPQARSGVRNFFSELYGLQGLDDLVKDTTIFTSHSADLGPDAREETLRLIEYMVFDEDADYRDLFTTRKTFLNRRLAALYSVPAPSIDGFALTELPKDGPRRGLLGQASVLAMHSHPTNTSATLRGKFVRTVLLCGEIPPPPANVDTSLPEASASAPTLRDRIQDHLSVPVCASCHRAMDPIGLALEKFDGIGKFRTLEANTPIDASGELDGTPFKDAVGLGEAIANHPNLGRCLTQKLYRYAKASVEREGEDGEVVRLTEAFLLSNFRIKVLLREIAKSDGFRMATEGE